MKLLLILLITSVIACAVKSPEDFSDAQQLNDHANKLYEKGQYTDALPYFESLRNRFPRTMYAVNAELKIADSYYQQREYLSAEASYQTFRSLHPTNKEIPYVLFQIGMTHFKRAPKSVDRDHTSTEKALEVFHELISRFPNWERIPDAREKMERCKRLLAERELYVVNFYLKKKQYVSAKIRLETLYANTYFEDLQVEATYKLGLVFFKLDDKDRAKQLLSEVVKNPKAGKYQRKAKKLLKKVPPK